ncbi:MAG: hypothetical protein ACRC8Y_24310 [Chroococcales cyanobacterium]
MNQIEYVKFPDGIQISQENPEDNTLWVSKDLYKDEAHARFALENDWVEWNDLTGVLI